MAAKIDPNGNILFDPSAQQTLLQSNLSIKDTLGPVNVSTVQR